MKAWASLWERDNVAGRGRLYCPVGPVLWPYGQALSNYVDHFHTERNHQGKGNILLFPRNTDRGREGPVHCRERLGGLLRYYHREAA